MASYETVPVERRVGTVVVARVLAWLCCVIAAVPMFGLIDLATVFGLADPQYVWEMPLEASWGSLFTFLIAGSFGWIGAVPKKPWSALVLLGVVAGALGIIAAVMDATLLWVAGPLAACAGASYALLRPRVPQGGLLLRPTVSAWSVAVASGAVLWSGYAWFTWVAAATGLAGDVTNGVDHWPVQVALGVAMAAGSLLMVMWRAELVLWRWAFVLTAAFVAFASLVYPDRAGAPPHWAWGVLIALWGVVVAVPPRRDRTRGDDTAATPGPFEPPLASRST